MNLSLYNYTHHNFEIACIAFPSKMYIFLISCREGPPCGLIPISGQQSVTFWVVVRGYLVLSRGVGKGGGCALQISSDEDDQRIWVAWFE